jgi:hypothetical protein
LGSTVSEPGAFNKTEGAGFNSVILNKNETINKKFISAYDTDMGYKFKSRMFEEKIVNQFESAKKKHNFQGMMKNLREAFEDKSIKEVQLMEQKNSCFKKGMNEIVFDKNKSQIKLENLRKEFNELDRLVFNGNLDYQRKK